MPFAPQKPCKHPRCGGFAQPGTAWCAVHARSATAARREHDQYRGTAAERGYDSKWSTQAKIFRQKFPLCTGVLIATPDWTLERAREFHALRMAAAERGEFLQFWGKEAPAWLENCPIYRFERLALAEPAEVVDHIVPHRGDQKLFWDQANWQTLSKRAHDIKTARHDGGFRGRNFNAETQRSGVAEVKS